MKKNLIFAGALVALMTACDYNDDNFEGLDELVAKKNVSNVEYTFAEADYPSGQTYFKSQAEAVSNIVTYLTKNYYALDNGSSVKVTFEQAKSLPAYISTIEAAKTYTLKTADYTAIWEGEEVEEAAYVTPNSVSRIPNVISTEGASAGDYAVVTYNYSETEPAPITKEEEKEEEKVTYNTIAEVIAGADGTEYKVKGTVAGIYKRGFLLKDATDYVLVYLNTETDRKIGDVVVVSGASSSYSGFKQFTKDATVEYVESDASFAYPTPVAVTGASLEADLTKIKYVSISGKLSISGNYTNLTIEGATRGGSISYPLDGAIPSELNGENVTITGYFIGYSAKYLNFMLTSITAGNKALKATTATTVKKCAIYKFDGTSWATATDAIVLSAADYTAMNQKYSNFSSSDVDNYLPIYLTKLYPYATEDQTKAVVYNYYGSDKKTVLRADEYVFTNGSWTKTSTTKTVTSQFVKNSGTWSFDPNVTINLPADKSTAVANFYQSLVDWVGANIEGGSNYITSYKNNEYYTGASAYQTNFDWRPAKAKEQYAEGYTGMSDDEIVAAMKQHTIEVFAGALPTLYPDADVLEGYEIFYTINFVVYTGTSSKWTITFKVVGKAQFEYVEGSLKTVE